MKRTDILIIGAGLAGLTAAARAREVGLSVLLLEKGDRAGGMVRSEKKDGVLIEHGPNTVSLNQELWDLIQSLGLSGQMVLADPKTPRFILHKNYFHPVPLSPLSFLNSRLLSFPAKTRALLEPLLARGNDPSGSLDALVRRRLGSQIADRLLAPFISGVWAGDPKKLSAADAMPTLSQWEKAHGSLLVGMISNRFKNRSKGDGFPKGVVSFQNGLETLTQSLLLKVGAGFLTGISVHSISLESEWIARTNHGDFSAPRVVLAVPAAEAAALTQPLEPEAAQALRDIPYAPLAVAHLSYLESRIGKKLRGFGFLTDPAEPGDILGCIFNSQLFTGRSPEGFELLTVFAGGSRHPRLGERSSEDLLALIEKAIEKCLEITGPPAFRSLTRHSQAIPQYTLGHAGRMKRLDELETRHPGLKVIGNFRGGISVGDVVREALLLFPEFSL